MLRLHRLHSLFHSAGDGASSRALPTFGMVGLWDFDQIVSDQYVEDLSGNGRHLRMGDAAVGDSSEPDITTAGRMFTSDYCYLNETVLGQSEITYMALFLPITPTANYPLMHIGITATSDGQNHIQLGYGQHRPFLTTMGTDNSWRTIGMSATYTPERWCAWHMYGLRAKVTGGVFTGCFHLDDMSEAVTFPSATIKPFNVSPLSICAINAAANPRPSGYLKAAVMYDRYLSDVEADTVRAALLLMYPQCVGFSGDARMLDSMTATVTVESIAWS